MPAGRPTDYRPEYCELLVEHMDQGLSFESFGVIAGAHKATLYRWADEHEEFRDAKSEGETAARHWWELRLARLAETNEGNATAIVFALKNKFPAEWRDRQQHEHMGQDGGPVIFQTIYESDKRGKSDVPALDTWNEIVCMTLREQDEWHLLPLIHTTEAELYENYSKDRLLELVDTKLSAARKQWRLHQVGIDA